MVFLSVIQSPLYKDNPGCRALSFYRTQIPQLIIKPYFDIPTNIKYGIIQGDPKPVTTALTGSAVFFLVAAITRGNSTLNFHRHKLLRSPSGKKKSHSTQFAYNLPAVLPPYIFSHKSAKWLSLHHFPDHQCSQIPSVQG